MQVEDLQSLICDATAFKKAFREVRKDQRIRGQLNEVCELLKDQFRVGRMPYLWQVVLPDGSQIRLKFVDTIKIQLNSKLQPEPGKESYLSYLEVIVAPSKMKAYSVTFDVNQFRFAGARVVALEKHNAALENLARFADSLGIDLKDSKSWCKQYSENY